MVGDSTAALDFLQRWAPDGPWMVTAVDPERKKRLVGQTFGGKQSVELLAFIEHWNGKRNLYFSVNTPRHEIASGKAKKEEIGWVVALHVDIDTPKVEGLDPIAAAAHYERGNAEIAGRIALYPVPPSVLISSGGGYQAFWLLATPVEMETIDDANRLESYNKKIEKDLGGDHCFNVDRIMRLPGTVNIPDAKKTAAGRVPVLATLISFDEKLLYSLDSFEMLTDKKPAPKKEPVVPRARIRLEPPEWVYRVLQSGPDHEGSHSYGGDRSKTLWAVCCALVRADWPTADILEAILDKTNKLTEHVYNQNNPEKYAARQEARARERAGTDFAVKVTEHKDGTVTEKVLLTQGNLRIALAKLDITLSYDAFKDRDMIEGPADLPLRHFGDYEYNQIFMLIDAQWGLRPAREYFKTFLNVESRANAYHPVRDYLDARAWDGTPRIDRWLIDYAGAADTEYMRAVGHLILIAAVRRVREPGCKFDEMMVFISPQGLDKSTALAALAVRAEWFTDSLPLDAEGRETIEVLEGKWIVEAAELKGMRNMEHLKALLSRSTDRGRKAYGHYLSEVPRQCVFFATTNSDAFLRDTTGNRRFWPVKITKLDVAGLRRDRDQLWAEAALREAAGESIRLDPALYAAAALEQERRSIEDPWSAVFEKKLGAVQSGKMLSADLWLLLDIPTGMRTQEHNMRMGEVMRNLGWERFKLKHRGISTWHYAKGTPDERKLGLPHIDVRKDEYGVVTLDIEGTLAAPDERENHIPL